MGNLASIESNTIAYKGAGMYGDLGTILFPTIFWQISWHTLCESAEADFPKHIHTPSHQYFWYYGAPGLQNKKKICMSWPHTAEGTVNRLFCWMIRASFDSSLCYPFQVKKFHCGWGKEENQPKPNRARWMKSDINVRRQRRWLCGGTHLGLLLTTYKLSSSLVLRYMEGKGLIPSWKNTKKYIYYELIRWFHQSRIPNLQFF